MNIFYYVKEKRNNNYNYYFVFNNYNFVADVKGKTSNYV